MPEQSNVKVLVQKTVPDRRLGIIYMTWESLELFDCRKDVERLNSQPRFLWSDEDVDYVRRKLILPDNCKINSIRTRLSMSDNFLEGEWDVAILLSCPDFKETPQCDLIPRVHCFHVVTRRGLEFSSWEGPAVDEKRSKLRDDCKYLVDRLGIAHESVKISYEDVEPVYLTDKIPCLKSASLFVPTVCPSGHDEKRSTGPCRNDYCSCQCPACRRDCEGGK